MQIVHYPHPALRWKSKPVAQIDAEFRATVAEMFDLMYAARGIGLAANQVDLPLRVFVINPTGDSKERDQEFVFINPEILARKGSVEGEEGCLSLPELFGQVRRAEKITVEAYDLDGRGFEMQLSDTPARVVQHENDHLDGVMFSDRMTDIARREIEPTLTAFEETYRRQQETGEIPGDDEIKKRLEELQPG